MANLQESNQWEEELYQVENNDPWNGGDLGIANLNAKRLGNRTRYLKGVAEGVKEEVEEAKEGAQTLKERIEAAGTAPRPLYVRPFVADAPVAASVEHVDIVAGGLLEIDGIQTQAGELVLLKDQSDPVENGFWEAQTGAWNRYAGYEAGNTGCFSNVIIDINAGIVNQGNVYAIDADAYSVGTDALIFKECFYSAFKRPGKVVLRDRNGEVGGSLLSSGGGGTDYDLYREGRDLLVVLGVSTVAGVMAELRRRCNNNGEIDATGLPDFSGLSIGDYLDGIDLSAVLAHGGGTAGQAWNDTYKNNRIVIGGFNVYKGMGDTENSKNHVLFVFRNIPLKHRMNPTDTNTSGYPASELRAWLEGVAGDGTGAYSDTSVPVATFMSALQGQLGGSYLCTIRKLFSTKSSNGWYKCTVFPPSELEVFGVPLYGDEGVYMPAITSPSIAARMGSATPIQYPIYRDTYAYRVKRFNGSRDWWWESVPVCASAASFADIPNYGGASYSNASSVGGCAPAFCVA
jgi:hypothetical protein